MKLVLDRHPQLWAAGRPRPDARALPAIHKDPFDRILVAQAIVESVTLLTADAIVARYPGPVRKI